LFHLQPDCKLNPMRIKIACLFSSLIMVLATVAQLPQTVSGKIDRIDSFPSKFVTARNVDVWVPDDYSKFHILSISCKA